MKKKFKKKFNNFFKNKDTFTVVEVVIIIMVAMLLGVVIGAVISYHNSFNDNNVQEFIDVYNDISNNYYDDKLDKEKLVEAGIEGMINSLDDPYSEYFNVEESESFNQSVNGNYVGIGTTVAVDQEGIAYILGVFENSPAYESGLKVNDIFVKIDKTDVSKTDIDTLTGLIKGEAGSFVNIVVKRGDEELSFKLKREVVDIPSVSSKLVEEDGKKIGVLNVSMFASNTYEQFNKELDDLESKEIDSLIIDVRSNPGGHLNQVSSMLSLFLDKGKVLYQLESKGKVEKFLDETKESRDYPIVVLVDGMSASASELFSVGLKESYKNIDIVGVQTYGKGSVQEAYEIGSGSTYKYTVQKWLSPKGNSIDKLGVSPTVEVKLDEKYLNGPTLENDNQYQKALEILKSK